MAVITLSRQFGARGLAVARRAAELLGYSLLDKAVVMRDVARTVNLPQEVVERVDEKGDDIVFLIEQVIQAAADRGNVVIVGRAGQAVLAERTDVLCVRVIAPVEFRRQRVAEEEGISPEEAMALIQRTDQDRARYHRQYYQVDWEDPGLYHLIIDTGRTDIELAARLIAGAVRPGNGSAREEERSAAFLV